MFCTCQPGGFKNDGELAGSCDCCLNFFIVKKGRQSLVFLMFWNPRSGALLESNNKKVPLNLILSSRLATISSQKLRKYLSMPGTEVGEPSFGKIFKILVKGQHASSDVKCFTLSAVSI